MRFWQCLSRTTFAAVVLFLISFAPHQIEAQTPEPSTSEPLILLWETEFSTDAALLAPSDFAVDAWGNIYVSVLGDMHIKKFDSEGRFVAEWGQDGTGEGEIQLSAGISVDTEGNVYVADFGNTRIQKFDSEGNFLLQWATEPPNGPASVTVDEAGFVYVDNFNPHEHAIQKFDQWGNLVNQWGPPGTGDGEFLAVTQAGPEDISLDPWGNVYVADRLNHRIQKFDADGNLLAIFGGEIGRDGGGLFYQPTSVAIDGDGNMYVADHNFLQKLDSEGNFIAQWSTDDGDLDRVRMVAVDEQGHIYALARTEVTTTTGNTIRVFVVRKFQQP